MINRSDILDRIENYVTLAFPIYNGDADLLEHNKLVSRRNYSDIIINILGECYDTDINILLNDLESDIQNYKNGASKGELQIYEVTNLQDADECLFVILAIKRFVESLLIINDIKGEG